MPLSVEIPPEDFTDRTFEKPALERVCGWCRRTLAHCACQPEDDPQLIRLLSEARLRADRRVAGLEAPDLLSISLAEATIAESSVLKRAAALVPPRLADLEVLAAFFLYRLGLADLRMEDVRKVGLLSLPIQQRLLGQAEELEGIAGELEKLLDGELDAKDLPRAARSLHAIARELTCLALPSGDDGEGSS